MHVDEKATRYLDDIKIGERFTSATYAIDEKQIVEFAGIYDPQIFHVDPDKARDTIFGGLIASGWHTAAIAMRLLLQAYPITGGTIGLGGEAEWPNPVRPGDTLHLEGEVLAVKPSRSHPDRGIVTIRTETKNQNNEIVQLLTAKLLVFRRP